MIFAIGLAFALVGLLVARLTHPSILDWVDETPKFWANIAARWSVVFGVAAMMISVGMLAWSYLP